MFDETTPDNLPTEDMFAAIDKAPELPAPAPAVRPSAPVAPTASASIAAPARNPAAFDPNNPPPLDLDMGEDEGSRSSGFKTFMIVLVIFLVVVAAGVISFFVLSSRVPQPEGLPDVSEAVSEEFPVEEEPPPEEADVEAPTPEEDAGATSAEPVAPAPEPDADKDGLGDVREAELGTNPFVVDTDADGLSDREEVVVYMTNPLVKDTDKDTYEDGQEVASGYNPRGAGKLFAIPPVAE